MEKLITVIIDGVPKFDIAIKENDVILDLKNLLKEYKGYYVRMYINPDTELKVFGTEKYDKMNFESVWSSLNSSFITLRSYQEMSSDLEKLDKNLLREIALDMELDDLMNLCLTSKKFNEAICNNNVFWKRKLNKDYNNVSEIFPNNTNFKELYMSFESGSIFSIQDFDNFDPDWRNKIDHIHILIQYLYRVEEFNINFYPTHKGRQDDEFMEYLMDYNYLRRAGVTKLSKPISERLINIYMKRYGKEAKKERKDIKFSKGLFGRDIIALFHPLLLIEFHKYKIQLISKGKIIEPNSFVEIESSSDT